MENKPQRITLSRAKGWRMPPNTVKVDRSTEWGNPYRFEAYLPPHDATGEPIEFMNSAEERAHVRRAKRRAAECSVSAFRDALLGGVLIHMGKAPFGHSPLRDHLDDIRGKNLACWCKPGEPCHADVLLELANSDPVTTEGGGE